MRFIILLSLLAACGTESEWAGSWKTAPSPPGSYVQMTLSGSGTAIRGSGTQYREAGTPVTFTVLGTSAPVPGPGVTFTYADNSTEGFSFAQPDANHLTLQNAQRTLALARQ